MLGEPDSEQFRFRLGLILLVIGLVLVLWAWGSWVFRVSVPEGGERRESRLISFGPPLMVLGASVPAEAGAAEGTQDGQTPPHDPRRSVQVLSLTTMTIVLLLIVLLFGSLAIVVGTRHWRALAQRKRAAPTPNEDVWSMHKIPEDPPD